MWLELVGRHRVWLFFCCLFRAALEHLQRVVGVGLLAWSFLQLASGFWSLLVLAVGVHHLLRSPFVDLLQLAGTSSPLRLELVQEILLGLLDPDAGAVNGGSVRALNTCGKSRERHQWVG